MNPSETGACQREALTFQLNFANKRNVWGREELRSECWRKGGVHYRPSGLSKCRTLLSLSSWVLVRLNWAELWQPGGGCFKQCHRNTSSSRKPSPTCLHSRTVHGALGKARLVQRAPWIPQLLQHTQHVLSLVGKALHWLNFKMFFFFNFPPSTTTSSPMTYFQDSWASRVADFLQVPRHHEAPTEALPRFCRCWAHGGRVCHRLWLSNPNPAAWLKQHWHSRDWHRDHIRAADLWFQQQCHSPHKHNWRESLSAEWNYRSERSPEPAWAMLRLQEKQQWPTGWWCCVLCLPAVAGFCLQPLSWAALHSGILRNAGIHSCCWISAGSSPQKNKQRSSNSQSVPKLLSEASTSHRAPSKDPPGPAEESPLPAAAASPLSALEQAQAKAVHQNCSHQPRDNETRDN